MWIAGAGVKGGQAIGATDELGFKAVETAATSAIYTRRSSTSWASITRG
jgi:hypothetical protein